MKLPALFGLIVGALCSASSAYNATSEVHKVTHIAWFDITIGGNNVGRIKIGLFGRLVPLTVHNFLDLTAERVGKGYRRSKLFIIQKGYRIGGGDWVANDGTEGLISHKGLIFESELLKIRQYGAGWLVMQHDEETWNISLFFISAGRRRVVKSKHVVFGKVIKGMNVVRTIENVEVDQNFRPIVDVVIASCGSGIIDPPFYVAKAPATD